MRWQLQAPAEFRSRRDACLAVLSEGDAPPVVPPAGAFYLFLDVSAAAQGPAGAGAAFAAALLEQHHVAVVAGNAFGTLDWIRMSYAAPKAEVLEGLRRIVAAWRAGRSSR